MLDFIPQQIELYALIFIRIFVIFSFIPIFSSQSLPQIMRVGLSLSLAVLIKPNLNYQVPDNIWVYALLLLGESLIGFIISLIVNIQFSIFRTAGQFFTIQMGLGVAMIFDPSENDSMPILSLLFNYIAMGVFLTTNSFQKLFMYGIWKTFENISVLKIASLNENIINYFNSSISGLLMSSLAMSFPIVSILLLVSIATGFMSKAAPQMNLLAIGFPITLLVGLFILFFVMPVIISFMDTTINNLFNMLAKITDSPKGI